MRKRLVSGIVLAVIVFTAVAVGRWAWGLLIALAATIAVDEVYHLARLGARQPARAVGLATAPALVLVALRPAWNLVPPVLAIGVVASFLTQLVRPVERRSADDWAATLAAPVYVGVLAGFLVLLRGLPSGLTWTVLLLALVWTNDTSAYLGGRAFGRTPFFPTLSPRKTLEGAATGTLATVVVAMLLPVVAAGWPDVFGPLARVSPWATALLALAISVVAPMGDLSKSFLKRQVGAKDSGDLIPGHGGMLDRIDSLLFAAPVMYYAALAVV